MSQPLEVASAFLLRGNKTYVSRRSDRVLFGGLVQNPGGTIDPRETPLQAVAREIGEETGLQLSPDRFHPLCETLADLGNGRQARVHTFVADLTVREIPRVVEGTKQGPWMLIGIDVLCRCPLGFTPAMPAVWPHLQRFVAGRTAASQ